MKLLGLKQNQYVQAAMYDQWEEAEKKKLRDSQQRLKTQSLDNFGNSIEYATYTYNSAQSLLQFCYGLIKLK